jgi:hypothetical protein
VILGETEQELNEEGEPNITVLWRNPYSENQPISPRTACKPTDNLASGNPEIDYIHQRSGEKVR